MRIKLLESVVSPSWDYPVGAVVNHEDAEAQRFIDRGIAVACPDIEGDLAVAFSDLGLLGDPLAELPADEQVAAIAAALAKVEEPGKRLKLAEAIVAPLLGVIFAKPGPDIETATESEPETPEKPTAEPPTSPPADVPPASTTAPGVPAAADASTVAPGAGGTPAATPTPVRRRRAATPVVPAADATKAE